MRDTAEGITGWYVLLTDIDDRKRAEDAVMARKRDLSSIINTIPMLAWSARPDGFCDFLNQRWLDFTGLSAEQARGSGWGSTIHPDDAKGLLDSWQMALVTGQLADVEARMRRFDGEYRWFLLRASPLRNESGQIVRWRRYLEGEPLEAGPPSATYRLRKVRDQHRYRRPQASGGGTAAQ